MGSLVGSIPTRPGFTYRFNTEEDQFSLDPVSGEIRTLARVDREAGDLITGDTRDLIVLSSSPTYPVEVVITVTDINDNSPQFPNSVSQISFSEGSTPGTRALLDSAIDIDTGNNGRIVEYRIQSGNEDGKFKLSFSNKPDSKVSYVHLETTSSLDREERSSFLLNITAADGGRPALTGSMLLTVNVLDINDNAPVFVMEEYLARINETAPTGSFVTQVAARDADTGENSRLSYLLAKSSVADQFNIDEETGVITVDPAENPFDADAEDGTLVVLEIEARDCGEAACEPQYLTDTATLTITVENVNDNFPKSEVECVMSFRNTDSFIDNIILELDASDLDGDSVKFYLMPHDYQNFPFSIEEDSGNIILDPIKLDEVEEVFTFLVLLADETSPEYRGSVIECEFSVADVNDNPPQFVFPERDARYWIDENSLIGVPLTLHDGQLLQLDATDEDVNECYHKLGYDFQPKYEEYSQYFSLDANSGQFQLLQNLSSLGLEMDNGKLSLVTLTVRVNDEYQCPSQDTRTVKTLLGDSEDLLLKVYKNFEPDFSEKSQTVDFDETLPGADSETYPSLKLRSATGTAR